MMINVMAEQKISLFKRQKLLLALLQAFGGRLPKTDLQKYLFLFTEMYEKNKSYEFVPYKYGCFSFQSYADCRRLMDAGIIVDAEHWQLVSEEEDYISQLDGSNQKKVCLFAEKFKNIRGDDLIRRVYCDHPYYAINSEKAPKIMSAEELKKIEQARPDDEGYGFFTIGYEGKSLENYLNRLIGNNVKVLCDVRKNPLSRKYGFSRKALSQTLNKLGIEYVHIPELGIASEKRQNLETQNDRDHLFDEYEGTILKQNHDTVGKLFQLFLDKKRVAITCFEADPYMCHRSRVAKILSEHPSWQYEIVHI